MGKKKSKKRTHLETEIDPSLPRSFVIKSGKVSPSVTLLVKDIRKLMSPHTATNLKERKGNTIKDFLMVAGQLQVTHLLVFSKSKNGGTNLRIGKIPRGPTLTFHVEEYSLIKDCLALQKRPKSPSSEYLTPPLVVLNNFDKQKHTVLMTTLLQGMFPAIKVSTMKQSDAKRIVLFNYQKETGMIEIRHYQIQIKTLGISKSIKSIISTNIPSLQNYDDVADFIKKGAFASESDIEDAPEATVEYGQEKRAVKLHELGPRMTLRLIKIQDGLCAGEVIHHEFITKSATEVKALRSRKDKEKTEKAGRRLEQEKNVQAKKKLKVEPTIEDAEGLEGGEGEQQDDYDEDDFSDLMEQEIDESDEEEEEEEEDAE
jgi:ribosome biogenesis protein SSF1/2